MCDRTASQLFLIMLLSLYYDDGLTVWSSLDSHSKPFKYFHIVCGCVCSGIQG